MSKRNKARRIEMKITGTAKNATKACEKLQNLNCFGDGPMTPREIIFLGHNCIWPPSKVF